MFSLLLNFERFFVGIDLPMAMTEPPPQNMCLMLVFLSIFIEFIPVLWSKSPTPNSPNPLFPQLHMLLSESIAYPDKFTEISVTL
jgi:hypothetical protein